jgi:hypothetical protein
MLLIPSDSPLRNPPADLNSVQKVAVDGLRFAFDMTHVSYIRLVQTLAGIGQALREKKHLLDEPTIALIDAWAVVDNLWRLHNILMRFPGLMKTADLKVHLRALAQVEHLRHGVQHLDQKIQSVAHGKDPILGSLTCFWTPDEPLTGGVVLAIAAGSAREGWTPLVNPAGRSFHRPIGLVTLSAFGKELELTALVARVVELAKGLDRSFREQVGDKPCGGSDFVMAAEIVFTEPKASASEGSV